MADIPSMTGREIKSTVILGLMFACRMFGLFMVLPVLSLYAGQLEGASLTLIGVAVGIYGLTQALLQFPCGMLSDFWGRKRVIFLGLVLFALGSLIACYATSIWGVIAGRAIQGAGAIGASLLAFLSDVTREEVRSRAMALLGVSIGMTFALSLLVGPLLDGVIGLSGIFGVCAILAGVACVLLTCLPSLPTARPLSLSFQLSSLFRNRRLWSLNVAIFVLHAILTACFLYIPQKIQAVSGLASSQSWRFYLPALGLSLLGVAPLLRYADNPVYQSRLMKLAFVGLGFAIIGLVSVTQSSYLLLSLTTFFVAFNFLEASLPAKVSKVVMATSKGGALGVYSFAQFLGMFAGGVFGGILLEGLGPWSVCLSCVALAMLGWFALVECRRNERWQEASIKLS